MKYQELTFQMIGEAILHRWKTIAITFTAFLTLGLVCGVLFADLASAEGAGSAAQWQQVDFDSVELDLMYYNNCYTRLSELSGYLYTYVDTVRLDITMTGEQSQWLLSLCKEITKYRQEVLSEISEALSTADTLYVPSALRQDAVEEYTQLRNSTQDQMLKAENAIALLQSIGALTSTNEDINATYYSLLSQAAQYGQLQLNLEKYEMALDRLENDYAQVQADSREIEAQLERGAEELDELGQECYQAVQEIALANHLDITTSENGAELTVLIDHTNRPANQQEAFTAFVLFFGLVGICTGAFFALLREIKRRDADKG